MRPDKNWILLIGLFLLLVMLRLPSFEMPLDPDSSANAFFARQMIRGETLYDKFHPAHQLPAIYYTYEFAFALFGDNPIAPKLLLIPWALACSWLIYLMGRSYFDELTGILGAIFFILASSQRWVTGMTVETEHFANLPIIAGVFLSVHLLRKQATWKFVWVGVLCSIAILYKVIFVAPLIVAGLSILMLAWVKRNELGGWNTLFLQLIWLGIGLIIPCILVVGYFASLGLWQRFLLVFTFGFNYFNDPQLMGGSWLPRPFGFPIFWMSLNNLALLVFGLIGTYRLVRRALPIKNTNNLTNFALAIWLISSMALAGSRGGGFAHYVLPVIPPLSLIAAFEISTTYSHWRTTLPNKKFAPVGTVFFVFLIVFYFIWGNYETYSQYINYNLGRISYDAFIRNIDEAGYASQEISKYIKKHTNSNDLIYVWSIYVDVYYYADRLPPIDILWPSYVSATGPPERIFDPHTKYIVLDTPTRFARPQWLMDGLAANYYLETTIEGREIYRRKSQ